MFILSWQTTWNTRTEVYLLKEMVMSSASTRGDTDLCYRQTDSTQHCTVTAQMNTYLMQLWWDWSVIIRTKISLLYLISYSLHYSYIAKNVTTWKASASHYDWWQGCRCQLGLCGPHNVCCLVIVEDPPCCCGNKFINIFYSIFFI